MSDFRRVAILGVGMIGATLARAARRARPGIEIWGHDLARPAPGVPTGVDCWVESPEEAVAQADLVILATPVSAILNSLPLAARACPGRALVTDTGSTKGEICRAAQDLFASASGPHFLGGHPMAGSERAGAGAADPDLLRGAPYVLCPDDRVPAPKRAALEALVRATGARPVWLDPGDHDRIVARVSHLPQLVAVALGSLLDELAARERRAPELAGSGLRDLLRLASSPYPLWRDICRTNGPALREAVEEMARRLREVSEGLEDERLERWFTAARHLREERLRVTP